MVYQHFASTDNGEKAGRYTRGGFAAGGYADTVGACEGSCERETPPHHARLYKGEIATGDHIIPRSIAPELDNCLFNLEFMPETLNNQKSNKVTERQVQLARRWNAVGLLSGEGLKAVEVAYVLHMQQRQR